MRSRSIGLLALLVLALSPAVARAETSSEKVYHVPLGEIESVPEETAVPHTHPKPHGQAKQKTGEESTERATEPEGETETGERRHPAAPSAHPGGTHPPGGGRSPGTGHSAKPPGASGPKPGVSISANQTGPAPSKTSAPEGGGGSSPLVPILIAVFVLAAISIGVVVYRQRRQDKLLGP